MGLVNSTDGIVQTVINRDEPSVLWVRICGLVEDIVSCNPGVAFVPRCELLPEPDEAVLEIFVLPEKAYVNGVVRMPTSALSTRSRVDVDDGVD